MSNTVLITGGGGYVGSCLVGRLTQNGDRVVSVDNGLVPNYKFDRDNVTYVDADIRDVDEWKSLLNGVDSVVHLAAIVGDPACGVDPDLTWETNYLGTVHLAQAARKAGVGRFVSASTCSNYGLSFGQEVDTFSPLYPQSVYAESKIHAEHYLLSVRDHDFNPTILRFATLFGLAPRMRFDLAINVMTAKAAVEGKVTVFNGDQWRPFLHVRDAAKAISTVLDKPNPAIAPEIYNVGSSKNNFRINDIAEMINAEVPGSTVEILKSDGDARDYRVNFDLIADATGFEVDNDVLQGIREIRDAFAAGSFEGYTDTGYSNYQLQLNRSQAAHTSNVRRHAHPWPQIDFTAA